MNVAILIGRLIRDPGLRCTPDGTPVVHFTLGVDRPSNKNGDHETDFVDVVAWRKLAEQVGEYAQRGRLVGVQGRLQIRSYETQNGQKRRAAEVVVSQVRFLDSPKKNGRQEQQEPAPAGDENEVPF